VEQSLAQPHPTGLADQPGASTVEYPSPNG
jgi:hypothetical protein